MAAWIEFRHERYQASGSRTDSSTGASGQVSAISSQNVQPGQSTLDSQPSSASVQSIRSPFAAATQ